VRVTTRPRVHAAHTVGELDAVDLEALELGRGWGMFPQEVVYVKVRPCEWEECGGSVLVWDGSPRCLLCARTPA